jgi:hypothetical protein
MVHIFPNRGIFHIATIFSNIGEWSNAPILHLMQLYGTYETILQLMQLYATIFQQFCMQLYANMQLYATMQLYETMQHATYAT